MKFKQLNIGIITVFLLFPVIFPISLSQAYLQTNSGSGYYNIDDGCPFPYDLSDFSTLSSLSLKQISYKGVFNSPNVDIRANYTIRNDIATNQTIGLFFPFSMETNLTIHAIEIDNQDLDLLTLDWRIDESIGVFPTRLLTENISLLSLEITFSAFEEKSIFLEYSLPYHLKSYESIWTEYRYRYFFKPLRYWDDVSKESIHSFHYEIWIPNSYLKNNGVLEHSVSEVIGSCKFIHEKTGDFSLIIYSNLDQPEYFEASTIEFGYQDTFSIINPQVSFFILVVIFLVVFFLLALSIRFFYRKINNLPLNGNPGD